MPTKTPATNNETVDAKIVDANTNDSKKVLDDAGKKNSSFAWGMLKIAGAYFGTVAIGVLAIGAASAASDKMFGTDMTGRKQRDLKKGNLDAWNRHIDLTSPPLAGLQTGNQIPA